MLKMCLKCNIIIVLFMFLVTFKDVTTHECPPVYDKTEDNSSYILDTPENWKIFEEIKDKTKFLALSKSLQSFMENIIVLGKYHDISIPIGNLQAFLIFVLDATTLDELNKMRLYWLRNLMKDELLKSRIELTNHILLKYDDVVKFIDENFATCKTLLTKITNKDVYNQVIDFYGKIDYPGIACLCVFGFDGLKFERENFQLELYGDVLFGRLLKEQNYFGISPRENIVVQLPEE